MQRIDLSNLSWHCPPRDVEATTERLTLTTLPETDFWQRTHYGFRRDDGHFLFRPVEGDFDAEVTVAVDPNAEYDQAGLMVRCSPSGWLKTSCEYQPDKPSHLGAVVTNAGYSDWSFQPVVEFPGRTAFRIERRGGNYKVAASVSGAPFETIRIARLLEDDGRALVQVGPYACSPKGQGCPVTFSKFSTSPRAA